MEFPGNSINSRINGNETKTPANTEATSGEQRVKTVANGKTTNKHQTVGRRFKDMFLAEGNAFTGRIIEDIVAPKIRDMLFSVAAQALDGVKQGFEEVIYGPEGARDRRGRTTGYGSRRNINYSQYSASSSRRRPEDRPPRGDSTVIRRSNRVRDIIVSTREEGDMVLEELDALIDNDNVGHATVGDYYTAAGEDTKPTDEEWGWTDLSTARVRKVAEDEYLIMMPRPKPIEG